MTKCVVIQPFDNGGPFDKRYADVFAPAITDAGLDPYRVDRDPSVSVPIDEIERSIRDAACCLADITTDNPNVWFELGYAIAAQREVVIVCSNERSTKYPFDVQHRAVVQYATSSPSDFEKLRRDISARIVASLRRREGMGRISAVTTSLEGLQPHEVAALVCIAEESDPGQESGLSTYRVRDAMERSGFARIAATLGLRGLLGREMVESYAYTDFNGETFPAYRATETGMAWLTKNQNLLALRVERPFDVGRDAKDVPF